MANPECGRALIPTNPGTHGGLLQNERKGMSKQLSLLKNPHKPSIEFCSL
jgi:hypothetical protein